MSSQDLNHSMISEDSHPIAIEHARLVTLVSTTQIIIKNTLALYTRMFTENQKKDPNYKLTITKVLQLNGILFAGLENAQKILEQTNSEF